MLLRSRPCKRGSCTGPLPSLLFSPRIHNYRNRIPGECPEKSFSYCVNSWRMPSEGPFAAFCAPPRIIEKIPVGGLSTLGRAAWQGWYDRHEFVCKAPMTPVLETPSKNKLPWTGIAWFGVLLVACYAPVLRSLVRQWNNDPDMG